MDDGFVKYKRKPEHVIAKDYIVENDEDAYQMFQDINSFFKKEPISELDRDVIRALLHRYGKYTVFLNGNGNISYQESENFYKDYELESDKTDLL